MPHLDGIGLAERASAKARRPAFVLLVTGRWTRTLDDRAANAGIDSRFLAATLDRADLRGELDRLLEGAAVEQAMRLARAREPWVSTTG